MNRVRAVWVAALLALAVLLGGGSGASAEVSASQGAVYAGVFKTFEHYGAAGRTLEQRYTYFNCDASDKVRWVSSYPRYVSSVFFSPRTVESGGYCNQMWVRNQSDQVVQWCIGWSNPWPQNLPEPWNDKVKDYGVRFRAQCAPGWM